MVNRQALQINTERSGRMNRCAATMDGIRKKKCGKECMYVMWQNKSMSLKRGVIQDLPGGESLS